MSAGRNLLPSSLPDDGDDNPFGLTRTEVEIASAIARRRNELFLAHLISTTIQPQPQSDLVAVEDIPSAWGY